MSDEKQSVETPPRSAPGWSRLIVGRKPRRTLLRILAIVILCYLVRQFAFLPVRVEGRSMEPTYHPGGINFVNRLAYLWSNPKRGDVVAIRLSDPSLWPPSFLYMKRVVGLPGETVRFHDGHILINGKILDEPYEPAGWDWESKPVTLEPGHYYVVGDNRTMPEVLQVEGRVRRDHIVGKVMLCKSLFEPSSSSSP